MSAPTRIFLSSPGDVKAARQLAALTIERLAQSYARFITVEPYLWEYEAMLASGHFQDSIEPPSAFDIVILIVWSRLGTPLPERTEHREYRGLDGRSPVTGTEWEFEDAVRSYRERQTPELLVYRNRQRVSIESWDATTRRRDLDQLEALDQFWERHFSAHGTFLAGYTEFTSDEQFATILEAHLRKLIDKRISTLIGRNTRLWNEAPFRGLEAYEFEHAPIFFGQDETVSRAILQLQTLADRHMPFLMVIGASGSGKSSLVKAALIPKLFVARRMEGVSFLARVSFRPSDLRDGEDLFDSLARRFVTPGSSHEGLPGLLVSGMSVGQLAAHFRNAATEPAYPIAMALSALAQDARREGRMLQYEQPRMVLLTDQLEELFTMEQVSPDQRKRFLELLRNLAASEVVWVICTMRKDFWHRMDEVPAIVEVSQGDGRLELLPPTSAQINRMIRQPAEAAGLEFEVHPQTGLSLADVIAEAVSQQPGALPLLSYLLDQLYQTDVIANKGNVLTFATYERLGKLEGALATKAEAVLSRCSPEVSGALGDVLFSLIQLGTADDGERPVSRRVLLSSFAPDSPQRRLVDVLLGAEARLLVSDAEHEGDPTVRIAHEALITHWDRAREFVQGSADALKIRRRIEERYLRWKQANATETSVPADSASGVAQWAQSFFSREKGLLAGIDLADGTELLRLNAGQTDEHLAQFIVRSQTADRRLRSRSLRLMGVIIFIIASLAVFALQRERVARSERDEVSRSELRLLISSVTQLLREHDVRTAEDLSVELLRRANANGEVLPELVSSFEEARAQDFQLVGFAAESPARSAVFASNEERVIIACDDGAVRIWDANTGILLQVLQTGRVPLVSAAVSRDGMRVAAVLSNATIQVWDATSGKLLGTLTGHSGAISAAAFSPSGAELASASADHTVRIWDLARFTPKLTLAGHADAVNDVSYSSDGTQIITASSDRTARAWDARTGRQQMVFLGHREAVWSARFSRDGKSAVTTSQDKTARVWDVKSGKQTSHLNGSMSTVHSADFSPDGASVVTGSFDHLIRIWDVRTASVLRVISGHTGEVLAVSYSADGKRILSTADDGSARIVFADPPDQVVLLKGHTDTLDDARYSPDAGRIITSSSDKTARLWDAHTFSLLGILQGDEASVDTAEFSPDGHSVVTASYDRSTRIWDPATFKPTVSFLGKNLATAATFSPDGSRVAISYFDNTATISDAATLTPRVTLSGHTGSLRSIQFSSDGQRVLTSADDGTARVWDAANGRQMLLISGHSGAVRSARYSPDQTRILTASEDKTAQVWDANSGKHLLSLLGHSFALRDAEYDPSGKFIVTAAYDQSVRLWDANTGAQLAMLPVHGDGMRTATFSPDGKRILVASLDGDASVWNFAPQPPLADQLEWDLASQFDSLTRQERARFGLASTLPAAADKQKARAEVRRLADEAHTIELAALAPSQADADAQLLRAFEGYTRACGVAEAAGLDESLWKPARFRRATIARLFAHKGKMAEIAAAVNAASR